MTRIILAAMLLALLAGCEDKEVARTRNERLLPAGCRIIDMDYGDLRAAVVCEGRKTTTSLRAWDETVMVPMTQADGTIQMMAQIQHHSSMSAEIGSR